MNYLTRLLFGLGLAIPMSAFAAEPTLDWVQPVYLNLGYSATDEVLYLKQKNGNCTIGSVNSDGVECVNSVLVETDLPVSDAFAKVLRMNLGNNKFGPRWKVNAKASQKQSSTLVLLSDLDFHEIQSGACVEEHFSLEFTGTEFDGGGRTISNLCKTIDDQTGASVGLFKEISNATVKNVFFSNVQFITSTENPSDLGSKYFPVGALAGKIFRSSVEGVDFTNVVIQAPLAGGLAGVIEESSISDFYSYGTGNVVKVSNEIAVIDGYVGECEGCDISYTYGYKALVGGLAGVTYQTSFYNINLQVDVQNKAAVDLSSVGGLVGLYVTKGNQNDGDYKEFNISKISIKGPYAAKGPVIAGGISMGGLLGETKRIDSNNYPKSSLIIQDAMVEKLQASQSKFKSTLPKAIYFGGLIGNGDICNSGKLEISNSSVTDFEITEAVKKNGIYQYYIGGFAGYAGCDHVNNSASTDLYLTLTKSKATGSINLSAKEPDIASTAEVHVSASIGGLVGAAVIAGNENAVAENEISVGITYDVKKTNAKIAEASEKVYIGGAFGTVNTYNSSAVVKGLRSSNYIKVVDDGIESYVGGVVGKFPLISSGDSKISFKDVQVLPRNSKKSILVDYEAYGTPGYDSYASVGGLCGDCSLIGEIAQSSVKGHFNKLDGENGSFEKKAFSLGGLVGKSRAAEAIIVKNTYSDGNISDKFAVEKVDEEAPKNKVGYLFGEIPGIQGQKESVLISNFHYGVDNVAAIGDADGSSVKNFTEGNFGEFTATNNVRNGAKTELTAKNNGYVSKDYMESSNFAAFLNSPWTESEDMVWAYSNDAGGLPFFGTSSTEPVVTTVPVVFKDGDDILSVVIGDDVVKVQNVKVGAAAVAPATPAPKNGQCFDKWSEDYTHIMAAVNIVAQYKVCEYTVKFTYIKKDGTAGEKSEKIEYNKSATPPSADDVLQKTSEGQCFAAWDATKDFAHVKGDLTVEAQYEICKYTVRFYVINDKGVSELKGEEIVEHGKSATAPEAPATMGGLCFDQWLPGFSNVTNKLDVTAQYKTCESSSSSDQQLSSSSSNSENNSESSSSENGTSSSSEASSSSWYGDDSSSSADYSSSSSSAGNGEVSSSSSATSSSSSSANDESSSSSAEHKKYLLDIAEPTATQDGKGLRMQFDSQLANMSEKVDYHIQVVSQKGIYLDTIVDGKTVGDVKNGTWRLDPAPAGRYTVTFMITDGVDSIPYQKTFTSMESREVASHSWQTLSLYAFCRDKGDECMSDLEALFARHRDHAENDVESEASVYWWDESSPIGDYWQYRKFSVNDKFDSTRGYWYGPIDNEPLVMSLETPDMKDEIVWHLENKYSGWNLVANPFGWYVTLPKEEGLQFCKWDPEASTYKKSDTLGPYEAIWVRTEKSMTYRIPLKAAIVLEEEKKSLNKSVASENWNLRVVLADNNGKRDSWNELAAGKTASTLGEPPAGMGDRVNLSIMEGKKRLVKSVKKNADDLEWDLEVSATTSREGHLSFEGLESVWSKGLRVYATVDNETVEVVKDSPVDINLSSKAKNVSVRVTKSAVAAKVAKNLLKGLHVGQMSNMLNVGFDAASKLAGANVKVSVVGIDGRVVATNRAVAREGSNAVSMKKPKQGVYFVKVKVGSQSAVTRIMVR